MTHAYHDALEGYSPEQILHDGCPECEERGRDFVLAVSHMDEPTFARAWDRAWKLHKSGLSDVSHAERSVLENLATVRIRLERTGMLCGS